MGQKTQVEIIEKMAGAPVNKDIIVKLAAEALKDTEGETLVELSVVDSKQISEMNQTAFKKNEPTDVISYDMGRDAPELPRIISAAVNGEIAFEEARKRGHSPEGELAMYALHGVLHQTGFDDTDRETREIMIAEQNRILKKFGIKIRKE